MDAYVAKVAGHLSAEMLAHLRAAFPLIRRRGYAMSAYGPSTYHAREATVLPIGQSRDDAYWASVLALAGQLSAKELQLFDINEAGPEGVSHISAPVFSPAGTVSLQLVISGMPRNVSAADIGRFTERLCAAAALVTSETHGRYPASIG